jgi:hypothetical protein
MQPGKRFVYRVSNGVGTCGVVLVRLGLTMISPAHFAEHPTRTSSRSTDHSDLNDHDDVPGP